MNVYLNYLERKRQAIKYLMGSDGYGYGYVQSYRHGPSLSLVLQLSLLQSSYNDLQYNYTNMQAKYAQMHSFMMSHFEAFAHQIHASANEKARFYIFMEDKINTGSQEFSALNNDKPKSLVNPEISDELTETVEVTEGGSFAIDPKTETMKRKRGQPRNQEIDHTNIKSPLACPTPEVLSKFPENSSVKGNRGRPKGSGKLQILATIGGYFATTAGGNFHPHAVIVNPGEDIVGKIIPFVAIPQQTVNILSAVGTVSSVLIYQPTSSHATTAFEGSFEILSLSGLYKYHNKHSVEGRLSISLAKPDGQVFGGIVGGPIIAENPIQLIVATFNQNVILKFQKRMKNLSSKVSVLGSRLGDSDKMIRVLTDTGAMTDDSIIPTTEPLPLESAYGDGGEDTVTPENEKLSFDSPKSIDVNALQVIQTNSKTSEDAIIFENKDTNVGEIDALKDCQSPPDEKTSSDTVDEDSDSEN